MPEMSNEHRSQAVVGEASSLVGGVWRLNDDALVLVDAAWSGTPVVLVASEDVLVLAVDLPIANRAQRAAALPFAIEDQVSEPIEALHTALGGELSPGRSLAGVVRHDRMMHWCALVDAAGLGRAVIVPDALALPAPDPGEWSVAAQEGRTLVRTAEGSAFAVPGAAFPGVWQAADRPVLISYGERLPDGIPADPPGPAWTGGRAPTLPIRLNLRQGRYAARRTVSPRVRRLGLVAAAGVLAHVAIFAVDTVALMRSAEARRAEVEALVIAAGGSGGGDLAATAGSMLPGTSNGPAGLLPLFSRAAQALGPVATTIALRSVTYSEGAGLTLDLEASDLAGLQQAEAALGQAGLDPTSTGSAVADGRASQTITLAGSGRAG